jgi:hypothetical protein
MNSFGDSPGAKVGTRNGSSLAEEWGRGEPGREVEAREGRFQFGTAGEVKLGFYGNLSSEHPEMERELQEFSRGYHEINPGCVRARKHRGMA